MAIRYVTKEQFDLIAKIAEDAEKPWFALALRTMFATGCRPSEVVGHPGAGPFPSKPYRKPHRVARG
jgi:hypothetical protein